MRKYIPIIALTALSCAIGAYCGFGVQRSKDRTFDLKERAKEHLAAEVYALTDQEAYNLTAWLGAWEEKDGLFRIKFGASCFYCSNGKAEKAKLDGLVTWRKVHDPYLFGMWETWQDSNIEFYRYEVCL